MVRWNRTEVANATPVVNEDNNTNLVKEDLSQSMDDGESNKL